MRAVDGVGEIDGRDLCIDRGAVEARVAKELLDVAHVGAALQEMRGARVPESMRRERLRTLGAAGVQADQILDVLRAHARAVLRQKQRRLVRLLHERWACVTDVDLQSIGGASEQRHDAILAAFAVADEEHPLPEVHVGEIEPLAFAHTQAGAVQQLEDRPTPHPAMGVRVGMRHQAARLLLVDRGARQQPPGGQAEIERGIVEGHPARFKKAKELLDAGEEIALRGNRVRPATARSQRLELARKRRDVRIGDGAEIAHVTAPEKRKQESRGLARVLDRRERAMPDREVLDERLEYRVEAPRIKPSLSGRAGAHGAALP